MKNFKYFFILFVLIIAGCNSTVISKKIQETDIDFVKSLKKQNRKDYIVSIDSVLNVSNRNDGKLALLYLKKGTLQVKLYSYNEALENFNLALSIFEKIKDKEYIAKTYWHMGSTNAFLSKKVIANKQLLKALQLSKEVNDKKTEANVYGSLAHTHYLYKDFNTSTSYIKNAIEIYEIIKDTLGLSSSYNNLAIIYKNIGQFENALEYNTKSLEISILQKDTSSIAKSHNNIGNLKSTLNDNENAIKHFSKAAILNNKKGLLNSSPFLNLGDLYLKTNNLEQSKYNYRLALNIENKKSYLAKKLELNNKLMQVSLQQKDFENALFYQQKRDSLNNIQVKKDTQEKLDLVENQYQLAASQQNLKQEQSINKKNGIIFLTILGLLFLLILFRFQYEKNKTLKIEKEKIYLEQKVLRSQMNPHFIFNVLSSIQNSLMDNDPIKSATYLASFAKLFRQNFDFIDKKTITLRDEIEVLENYVSAQKLRYKDKFDYQINISDNINIDILEVPPLLLQPFLENAIEHGFKNKKETGTIKVTISKNKETVWYEILDNGKGFDTYKKSKGIHALDIFIKRLKLLGKSDEKSLVINSSNTGTSIKFGLKND